MPPHSRIVLPYHNGKCPDSQASAKLVRLNGGAGNKDARSIEPALACRMLASAIQANDKIHSKAAVAGSKSQPALRFIMNAALQVAQRDHRDGKQECHTDHRRGRGQSYIVVLM